MAGKALKLHATGFSGLVYTERVGSSNLSPPTSLRPKRGFGSASQQTRRVVTG
jgi:hypothetical protein